MKLLIGIPSPRSIPEFTEAIAKIPYDKVWIKNAGHELQPYQMMRSFFLEHAEYTHLAICSDDLIVTLEGVEHLIQLAEKYPLIMGICNVNIADHPDGFMAVAKNEPRGRESGRTYDFYTRKELKGKGIIRVKWSGFAFPIFARQVVEAIHFDDDGRWNGGRRAGANDIAMCHDLNALGIPIMVDTSVYFYHHRIGRALFGKDPPELWYDRDGIRQIVPFGNAEQFLFMSTKSRDAKYHRDEAAFNKADDEDKARPKDELEAAYEQFISEGGLNSLGATGNKLLELLVKRLAK